MKAIVRSVLKWLYFTAKSRIGVLCIPKQYKFEFSFFENIRKGTFSDVSFRESKLRSMAHQIDKTLVFSQIKERRVLTQKMVLLIDEISKLSNHDTITIQWAKNVLSEYENRLTGNVAPIDGFKQFDDETRVLLKELIQSRRSIRSYKPELIDRHLLKVILQAGLWAPTGCNRQTIEYLMVEEKDHVRLCQRLAGESHSFPEEAPVSVVVLVDSRNYALPGQRHMAYLEGGAAVQNILLTAYSYGIGTCWLFWHAQYEGHTDFVKRFNLKPWLLPVAMVSLGYPDKNPKIVPERKNVERSIHWANSSK